MRSLWKTSLLIAAALAVALPLLPAFGDVFRFPLFYRFRGTYFPTSDGIAPVDGALTVTSGNAQNSLVWSAATDNIAVTQYIVVVAVGTPTSPPDCSGAALYAGASTNFTHTGLTNLTEYAYRVCAVDGAGNRSTGLMRTGYPAPPNTHGANLTATIGQYFNAADSTAWEHSTYVAFGFCPHIQDIDSDDAGMLTKSTGGAGNAEWGAAMIMGSSASVTYIMSFFAGGAIANFVRVGGGAPYPQNVYRCFMASIDTTLTQAQCVYSVPNPAGGTPGLSCTTTADCPGASVSACSINQNRIRVWVSQPGTSAMTLTYATAVSGTVPATIPPTTGLLSLAAIQGSSCIGSRTHCTFGSAVDPDGGGPLPITGAYFDQPWAVFGADRATVTAAVSCLYPNGYPTMTPWRCFASGTRGFSYWLGDDGESLATPPNRWPCGGALPACGPAMTRVGAVTYQPLPSPPY